MAEALVSLLVQQLGSVVYQHTSEGVTLVLNAKKDVDKFRRTLKLIQNVLHDAEKKQVEDPAVRDWLDELKDVSYKMDDVLDAWNTEIGKREAEKHETQGSDAEGSQCCYQLKCWDGLSLPGSNLQQEVTLPLSHLNLAPILFLLAMGGASVINNGIHIPLKFDSDLPRVSS